MRHEPTIVTTDVPFTLRDENDYEYPFTELRISATVTPAIPQSWNDPGEGAGVEFCGAQELRGCLGWMHVPPLDKLARIAEQWVRNNEDWLIERGTDQAQGEADDAAERRAEARRDQEWVA